MIKDFRNEMLKRREVEMVIESVGNPGVVGASQQVAKHFKTEEENIALKSVKGSFGSRKFDVVANIYDSVEAKHMIEPKKKEKKK